MYLDNKAKGKTSQWTPPPSTALGSEGNQLRTTTADEAIRTTYSPDLQKFSDGDTVAIEQNTLGTGTFGKPTAVALMGKDHFLAVDTESNRAGTKVAAKGKSR